MKRLGIMIMLCVSLTLAGCQGKAKEANAAAETENGQTQEKQGVDVFGEVQVGTTKEIFIDFPARVVKVHVKDGQKIKKGDKILTLDFDEYQTNIAKKQNEVALYQGQLKELQQNINPLSGEVKRIRNELDIKEAYLDGDIDPDIKVLKRSVELAEDAEKTAKKEYDSDKEIFEIGGISPQELELSRQNLNSKQKDKKDLIEKIETAKISRKLEISQLQAALHSNEAQLTNTDKENETGVLELESKLKTAKMDLEIMKNKLAKSYIVGKDIIADADNMIVYDITCSEGSLVGSGEAPSLKIMDGNTIYVSVDIPEEFISKAAIGSKADIVPYADKNQVIKGKISRLSERGIKQNGETIIKADIEAEGNQEVLKPGLTVDVKIYE